MQCPNCTFKTYTDHSWDIIQRNRKISKVLQYGSAAAAIIGFAAIKLSFTGAVLFPAGMIFLVISTIAVEFFKRINQQFATKDDPKTLRPLLIRAINREYAWGVKALLFFGASPDLYQADNNYENRVYPLQVAATIKNADTRMQIIKSLVEHGADINRTRYESIFFEYVYRHKMVPEATYLFHHGGNPIYTPRNAIEKSAYAEVSSYVRQYNWSRTAQGMQYQDTYPQIPEWERMLQIFDLHKEAFLEFQKANKLGAAGD